jgi:hypothetical protein
MKLERAASVVGVIGCLMLVGGCAGSRGAGASARPVVTDEGAVASADPIGASLFAGSRGDESPRPMLTSATIEE